MLGAKVNVVGGWGAELAREINEGVRLDVRESSEHGAEVARGIAGRRRRTGKMADIEVLPVRGTPTGWEGGIRSPAWYARFQSKGTSHGITPLGFLEAAEREMEDDLRRRIDRRG